MSEELALFIYILRLSVCLSVCRLYPVNVKTAEPIGSKICVGPHYVIFCLEPDSLISQFHAYNPIEEKLDIPEYQKIYQELENSYHSSDYSNIQNSTANVETCSYQYQDKSTEDSILTLTTETLLQFFEETPSMSTEYLDSGFKASKSKESGLNSQPLKDLVCRPKRTRGGSRRSIPYLIQPLGNDTSSTREFSTSYDQGAKNLPDDVSYEENGWSDLSTKNQSNGNAKACKKYRANK